MTDEVSAQSSTQHRRDYQRVWKKANRKKSVHGIVDEYIRFVQVDEDITGGGGYELD